MRLAVITLPFVFAALLLPQQATAQRVSQGPHPRHLGHIQSPQTICPATASSPCFQIMATPTWVRNAAPTYTPPGVGYNGPLGHVEVYITVQSTGGFAGVVNLALSCCNDGTDNPMVPSGPLPSVNVDVPLNGTANTTYDIDLVRQGNVTSCPETVHTCPYYLWPRYGEGFLVTIVATSNDLGNNTGWPFFYLAWDRVRMFGRQSQQLRIMEGKQLP